MEDLKELSEDLELNWVREFLYHVGQSRWEIDHYVNPLMCFETLWLMSSGKHSNVGNRYGQV
jgi:hypothetical protein